MARTHYHVHQGIPGYLPDGDGAIALTLRDARELLRQERNDGDDAYGVGDPGVDVRRTGSLKAGRFDWEGGIGWSRYAEIAPCDDPSCLCATCGEGLSDAGRCEECFYRTVQ